MDEKRQSIRYECKIDVRLTLEDREIPCRIVNLSEGGALILVAPDSDTTLTRESIGKAATFQLRNVRSQGSIVRFLESDGAQMVALRYEPHPAQDR